jgi:hypothetical protein
MKVWLVVFTGYCRQASERGKHIIDLAAAKLIAPMLSVAGAAAFKRTLSYSSILDLVVSS